MMTVNKMPGHALAAAATVRHSAAPRVVLVLAGIAVASGSVALELSTLDLQRLVDPQPPRFAGETICEAPPMTTIASIHAR
jgi:hypothetical protein